MVNDFGYEEEVQETDDNMYAMAPDDDYSGGAEVSERFVGLQWFPGIKTWIIDPATKKYIKDGEGERKPAKGMAIPLQWAKNDAQLLGILDRLVKEKKAVIQLIEHSGGEDSRQRYAFLNDWSIAPVTLNAIDHRTSVSKPDKISGFAAGVTVDEDTAYKGTYVSMLIVSRTLYEAGYVDDAGNPRLLRFTMKGYNAGNENTIMQGAVKRQTAYRAFDIPGLNPLRGKQGEKIVRGGEELFEYWIRMGTSAERVDRGTEPIVSACFEAVDLDADPALWTPAMEKKQWIGVDLYKKIFPLVYVFTVGNDGKKKRIPGGISKTETVKTLARHSEICNRLDPEGKLLRMGKNDVPAAWKIKKEMEKANQLKAAVQGEPEVTPAQAAVARYQTAINTYREMFFADEEGCRLVDAAQHELNDPAPGRGPRVGVAMQALKDYEASTATISDF